MRLRLLILVLSYMWTDAAMEEERRMVPHHQRTPASLPIQMTRFGESDSDEEGGHQEDVRFLSAQGFDGRALFDVRRRLTEVGASLEGCRSLLDRALRSSEPDPMQINIFARCGYCCRGMFSSFWHHKGGITYTAVTTTMIVCLVVGINKVNNLIDVGQDIFDLLGDRAGDLLQCESMVQRLMDYVGTVEGVCQNQTSQMIEVCQRLFRP